jgi:hypothetical protein
MEDGTMSYDRLYRRSKQLLAALQNAHGRVEEMPEEVYDAAIDLRDAVWDVEAHVEVEE